MTTKRSDRILIAFSSFAFSFHTGDNGDIAVNAGLVISTAIDRQFHINTTSPGFGAGSVPFRHR